MGLQAKVTPEIKAEMARQDFQRLTMAQHLGVTYQTLYRKLIGETPMTLDELGEIATALGLKVRIELVPASASDAPTGGTPGQVAAHILDDLAVAV